MEKKTKVLIVDDEKDAVATLQFRLANIGYAVVTAQNGAEALELLRDTRVDLILADFMMPEINGLELARLVKSNPNWYDTRIILFSCNTDPEFRRRAIDLGALDYLPKTGGYGNIVQRVTEIAAPSTESQSEVKSLAEDSPEEKAYRQQLRSLSQSLIDVLQLAQMSGALPDSARFALDSANRIAEDIRHLSDAEEQPKETDNTV